MLGIKDPSAIDGDLTTVNPNDGSDTVSVGDSLNLAGLNQATLTDAEDIAKLTNNTGSGYIRDITKFQSKSLPISLRKLQMFVPKMVLSNKELISR